MLPDAITREVDIDAPPDVVWAIITEAQHLAGWFSDEAEIDLREGGAMLLTWHGHGAYRARVETVEPPATFASRWVLRDREGWITELDELRAYAARVSTSRQRR